MFGPQNLSKMKKYIILTLLLASNLINAQDTTSRFYIPIKNWDLQIVAKDNFYPTYLADPLGIRFGVSSQTMKYSDFDHSDMVNTNGSYLGKLNFHQEAILIWALKLTWV